MPNSMGPDLEQRIDLYVRGELSPVEARELAQEALRRPDLFEELNAAALAKAAIESESNAGILERYLSGQLSPLEERELARKALHDEHLFEALATHGAVEKGLEAAAFRDAVLRKPRSKIRIFAIVGSIAAAAFLTVYLKSPAPISNSTATKATVTHRSLKPTLDPSANTGQPILFASNLRHPDGMSGDPDFRGPEPESRPPQQRGSILAIEERLPTVNLGSLDGLTKGTELNVFRDGRPVGRMVLTTIFRDRARGRMVAGETIRVGDQVRANDSVYLSAVLDRMDALEARGGGKKAIEVGQKALDQLGANGKLLERMALLEYQNGALDAALQHYEAAAPQETLALNTLAVLYLLRGDYARAEPPLHRAISGNVNAESLNNLGVAAELRGDSKGAALYYGAAFRLLPEGAVYSRKLVQANLTRVTSLK